MTSKQAVRPRPIDRTRYGLAVLAYLVVTFVAATMWHLMLFANLYAELAIFTREQPIVPLGLSSMLVQALILAYVYPHLCRRERPAKEGLVFGFFAGMFIASCAVLAEAGKQNVTSLPTFLALETVYYALQFALSGLAIALVYGKADR